MEMPFRASSSSHIRAAPSIGRERIDACSATAPSRRPPHTLVSSPQAPRGAAERWKAASLVIRPFLVLLALAGCGVDEQKPNLVLIVVDTLRADRLPCMSSPERDTGTEICERLTENGVVFERAYAHAPWTLPSMASLLSGYLPDELGFAGSTLYDIPAAVPTLAERLRDAGYRTAAFVANPTLQPEEGFGRGFEEFQIAEPVVESLSLNAQDQLQPWLEQFLAEQSDDTPFFLWAHYLDPHDPYLNPLIASGQGRSDPQQPVAGDNVHGVYAGRIRVDPDHAATRFSSLYDDEVRYLDRFVADLIDRLAETSPRETLVVFTSDHGEEFYEHEGWKHGQTLYEEQVRVPLVISWSKRTSGRAHVEEAVGLADIAPTLLDAAGLAWEGLSGESLLSVVDGMRKPSRRPVFFQHLSSGPLRAGAVLGDHKLILFNARDERREEDPLALHLEQLDRARLPPIAAINLANDPLERQPRVRLAPSERDLELEIHRRLLGTTPGTRVLFRGSGSNEVATITIVADSPLEDPIPYFLSEADQVDIAEQAESFVIKLSLTDEPGMPLRGLLLSESAKIQSIRADNAMIQTGTMRPTPSPVLRPTNIAVRSWLPARSSLNADLTVFVFRPDRTTPEPGEVSQSVRKRLGALGYTN